MPAHIPGTLRPRSLTLSLALLTLGLAALCAGPARASLALIRQGAESRGAIEAGDYHGGALAAGDFNGDGFEDLATGAYFEDVSGFSHAGAVIINFGSLFGLTYSGSQLLLQSDGDQLEDGALFGFALAAGDFDGDGYEDLAIGAPNSDADASHTNTGYVFVYAGGPNGLSYWHYLWQPSAGGTVETNDRFGASLCAGYFDSNNAREDLAIGSPGEDSDAGAVFFYTGGSNGLLNGTSGWRKQSTLGGTNVAGDQFGYSLASGQVWGSTVEELIVGTPFKEIDGVDDAGSVWIILGTSTGLSASTGEFIRPDEGDLTNTPYPDGYFGYAVAAGRFYGGTYEGVAVGEPGRSYFGHPESGRVVVGGGSASGVTFTGSNVNVLFQDDAGWSLGSDDSFGRALAAGYFDTPDNYEDLAVGSPFDNANGGPFGAGVVSILFGGTNGPGAHGWYGWAQDAWHEAIESNDQFGRALVFGRFEAGARRSLAIGAPGEDSAAGMVLIAAPWRQRMYPDFQNGISVDCEGNWTYALRPFDEICIASTTKIMTVLIACERSQLPHNDPDFVDLNEEYEVPDWIRYNIGGSLYGFRDQQRVSLWELLHCCLYPSGNDAAFGIADMLTGGNNTWGGAYDNTVQTFVDEMNDRAAALGMSRTEFTNPAGLDKGGPHSCARDMIVLAQAAMANATFRSVASNTSITFLTSYLNNAGTRVSASETLNYSFLQNMQGYNPNFSGLKPGRTPCAKTTGVFSANWGGTRAYAATFGTVVIDDNRIPYREDADALMDIGLGWCGGSFAPSDGSESASRGSESGGGSEGYRVDFGSLSTAFDARSGGAADLYIGAARASLPLLMDVYRPGGTGVTRCEVELRRSGELELGPLEEANLGIAPYQSRGDILLCNQGESPITVAVTMPQVGPPLILNIPVGGHATIPGAGGNQQSSWLYSIENQSQTQSAYLAISETFSFALTGLAGGNTPSFSAQLMHSDKLLDQAVGVAVRGTDPVSGRSVNITLHDANTTVDVPDETPEFSVADPIRLLPATPNPFHGSTHIGLAGPVSGQVRLEIFDLGGRSVRTLEPASSRAGNGGFDWDGRSADGRAVAPGVFFYRVQRNGQEVATGRVTLVR